jgi:hypothetical protein
MSFRRRSALVLTAAAVSVAAIALVIVLIVGGGSNEPALDAHTSYDELSTHRRGGETVANGLIYMTNRSKRPLTLESAKVLARGPNVPSDFRFLVAGPNRTTDAQGGVELRCPPTYFKRESMVPLKGFVLQPASTPDGKQGAVLIVCFTVPPAPARFRFTETSITYLQDGERHTVRFPNVFRVCAAKDGKCDPDATAQNDV